MVRKIDQCAPQFKQDGSRQRLQLVFFANFYFYPHIFNRAQINTNIEFRIKRN